MLRRTPTYISVFLLLMTVATWGISYYGAAYGRRLGGEGERGPALRVTLSNGILRIAHVAWTNFDEDSLRRRRMETRSSLAFGRHPGNNFGRLPLYYRWGSVATILTIPLWIPTLAFAVLAVISLVSWSRRRWRTNHGLCVSCSYDLRGSVGACPECGHSKEDAE